MPQVWGPEIKDRAARLRAAGEAALAGHLQAQVGRVLPVLMEGVRMGRTEGFAEVDFGEDQPEGRIIRALILGVSGGRLVGSHACDSL